MDYTGKILKIDNSNDDRVDFWISNNADKTSSFTVSVIALEPNKTISELMQWAYQEYLKRKEPLIEE